MTRIRHLLATAAIAVTAVGLGNAGSVSADHQFRATGTVLSGAQEVPGPGDPDGVGLAGVTINVHRGRICYALGVKHIEPAAAAHIHRGDAGVAGPIAVTLDPPTDGFSAECLSVDRELAGEIAHNPRGFYINVHNVDFPAGAVRGQLH
jgi:hypothetical protein